MDLLHTLSELTKDDRMFFRHSGASLILTTSDLRIRWLRFDWLVTQHRTDSTQENPLRKDAQRGHSKTLDHRKMRPNFESTKRQFIEQQSKI